MVTPYALLVVVALVLTIVSAVNGKVPLWIAVLLLCMAMLMGHVPVH